VGDLAFLKMRLQPCREALTTLMTLTSIERPNIFQEILDIVPEGIRRYRRYRRKDAMYASEDRQRRTATFVDCFCHDLSQTSRI
jgi:hypothetical protein